MSKIIIKNNTDLSDLYVMYLVCSIIKSGRISDNGKAYCYLTSFQTNEGNYYINADLRKCSDVFTCYKSSEI